MVPSDDDALKQYSWMRISYESNSVIQQLLKSAAALCQRTPCCFPQTYCATWLFFLRLVDASLFELTADEPLSLKRAERRPKELPAWSPAGSKAAPLCLSPAAAGLLSRQAGLQCWLAGVGFPSELPKRALPWQLQFKVPGPTGDTLTVTHYWYTERGESAISTSLSVIENAKLGLLAKFLTHFRDDKSLRRQT